MPDMSCPNCQTIRAPNAVYCHVCGHVYRDGAEPAPLPSIEPPVRVVEHRVSFGTAVTVGAGLAIGGLLVGILSAVIGALVLGAALDSMMRSLPGFGG
jgi:rubredoxin